MGVALVKFAHEFANELSFVSGAMQFLENDIERPHQARNALQHVKSGIQRLDSLLNELRTLAQPQRLSLQPTQLASVIKESWRSKSRATRQAAFELKLIYCPTCLRSCWTHQSSGKPWLIFAVTPLMRCLTVAV